MEAIKNMIDNILDDNAAGAQENFLDVLSTKVTDALDAKKIEVAQNLGAHDEVQAD